jgi:hypothetical protein
MPDSLDIVDDRVVSHPACFDTRAIAVQSFGRGPWARPFFGSRWIAQSEEGFARARDRVGCETPGRHRGRSLRSLMLARTLIQSQANRSMASRRLHRNAAPTLYCRTNGCTTFMQLEANGEFATCPICGARRRITAGR